MLWEPAAQTELLRVDLYIDDQFILRLPANIEREDLKERGFRDGKHGFRFEIPWWVRDGRPHVIEVKDVKNNLPLKNSPQTVECERNEEEIQREEEKLRKAREAALDQPPAPTPATPATPSTPAPK